MIFNSQGDAKLRQYINGQTITPGDTAITLPKGAQLLGDVTIEAVDREAIYQEGYNAGYAAGYAAGYDIGYAEGQAAALPYSKELLMSTAAWQTVFGAWNYTNTYINSFTFLSTGSAFRDGYASVHTAFSSDVSITSRHTVDKNKNVCTVDRTSVTVTATTFTQTYPVYLFCGNTSGTASEKSNSRIYSCKMYDNGTLVRDYIPVLDYTGVACLYDKVEKKLYYNQGSGSFSYAA